MADNARAIEIVCRAAIRGKRIPENLDKDVVRASLIRGIRLHYDFAISDEVTNIARTVSPVARARNARMIMSNVVPQDMAEDQQPYCIWYPDFATEDAYRTLAERYPQMRYGVGRACAAAGYDALYFELNLLPDVSIAEEARESETEGGRRIYESIMSRPCRYAVMKDVMLSVETENPRLPAFLNGDTELTPGSNFPGIEEDMHVNDEDVYSSRGENLNGDEVRLLYEPLPQDLPTVKKTLLTEMAAFEGNIDRYSRLAPPARPMNRMGLRYVIRGIYHHTMYARWWADEIQRNTLRAQTVAKSDRVHGTPLEMIKMAISARRIMVNDPREFLDAGWPPSAPQPYLIWWPLRPEGAMLTLLAEKVPSMKEQAGMAAIICDYESSYSTIQPTPNANLWLVAERSANPFYCQDLKRRAAEQGITDMEGYYVGLASEHNCLNDDHEPTCVWDFPPRGPMCDGLTYREGPYDEGFGPDTREMESKIWQGLPGT
ncbi:hypothetical protein F5X98DRAFT_377875 [Xylaria grammica]|nr:hypothetical protein F5X98DRAFT_377875 [Xylaria grammica]